MKLIITQASLTLKGGDARVVLKIAQRYDAKIYTAEYDKRATFPEFAKLDVNVVGKGFFSKMLPYGRVSQGLNYGLSFYNLRIRDDYDVINAHIAPSHWVSNLNDRVLWYAHTPLRDFYDLYAYRLAMKRYYQKPVYMLGTSIGRAIDQKAVKRIRYILTNSENTKRRIAEYYHRNDATVLGGGIDCGDYRNDGDKRYFIYVSRISPNKRQDYAIRAFQHFKRRVKGYKLLIVGPVSKDKAFVAYYEHLKALARRVGDVRFIANADDKELVMLYAGATAALYAPINEDYGLVPLEAMASQKPIISVNEGGPKETIENGKTGFLVDSEEEMAAKMEEIALHPAIAKGLGKNGRNRVSKKYSWTAFFKGFDVALKKTSKS